MVEIKQNKHIYAAYANMAQHNFFMTMGHIAKCIGKPLSENDEDPSKIIIDNLDSKKTSIDKKQKMCELLNKHFPFLLPMVDCVIKDEIAGNQVDAYSFILPKITRTLNFYRNYTTHFDPDEEDEIQTININERSLVPCLKDVFKASLRTVQQRFGYEEREISFIKNKDMGKVNSKYSLYKKEVILPHGKPEVVFSLRGLVFFISLFLEKKYINEMLDKTKAFYTYQDLTTPKRKNIIFESVAVYRIKIPKKRYESEQESVALALDMVNELQRCPQDLFDLLSAKDQELFRSEPKDDDDPNTMLMIRHSDRFAYHVLRYIDQQEIFKTIRFQINLGKYRFAFYDKKCIDNNNTGEEKHVRSLEKELHGFGRLQEIENERREKWATLIRDFDNVLPDTADSIPYITDHHASYVINNNRIGLYWKAGRDEPSEGLPTLPADPQAKDLMGKKKNGETIVSLTSPKCFMSTHELVALVFYLHLCDSLDDKAMKEIGLISTEKIIKDWTQNFKRFVIEVIDGNINKENAETRAAELGIDFNAQLPKKLQEFINGIAPDETQNNKKLQERLSKHIVETQVRIERFGRDLEAVADKRNRRGTRKFVEIKPGRLGSWLAHDIIALQPIPSEGNKLTGLNFQILQSALSVYEDLDSIKRILVSARLIMHDESHPFLMKVVDSEPQSTAVFYKKYLEEKLKWLQSISDSDLRKLSFLTRGENKWSKRDDAYYRKVMQKYLDLPAELPRGLFTNAIKKLLVHKLGTDFIKGDNREDTNVTFLVTKYFKSTFNDESQEFYTQPDGGFKRYYSFFKMLADEKADYGMTVKQVEDFLMNDASINMLSRGEKSASANVSIEKGWVEEVQLKLAKAIAKNPSLDKEQRIKDIISASNKLRNLSVPQQNEILKRITGNSIVNDKGAIEKHLEKYQKTEDKENEREHLSNALRKLKSTEHIIRRYKVQDIITFLMARDMLFAGDKDVLGNKFDSFKLKNIRPIRRQDGVSALEIKVPFSIVIRIKGFNMPIRISQKSIKLKNYGDFMRFLYDSRIETLIPYLVEDNAVKVGLDRAALEKEFENYDRERLNVFENVHKIEQLILERHKELKDKSSAFYYYDDGGKKKAARTNFSRMLSFANSFTPDEEREAVNIRNSFSHNSYYGQGFGKVKVNTKEIGDIAKAISKKMNDKSEKIKKKNNGDNHA